MCVGIGTAIAPLAFRKFIRGTDDADHQASNNDNNNNKDSTSVDLEIQSSSGDEERHDNPERPRTYTDDEVARDIHVVLMYCFAFLGECVTIRYPRFILTSS